MGDTIKKKSHFPVQKLNVEYSLTSAALFVGVISCSTILINITNAQMQQEVNGFNIMIMSFLNLISPHIKL